MKRNSAMDSETVIEKKTTKRDIAKSVVRFIVGGLVEIFIGAATNSVLSRVDSSRPAKIAAKAGGFLVGLMVSDHVSNYVCDTIDETMFEINEMREAMEEED